MSLIEHAFNKELRTQVASYFRNNRISPKGGRGTLLKTILIMSLFFIGYLGMLIAGSYSTTALFLCLFVTLAFQLIASLSVMHDASHHALSHNRRLNTLLTYLIVGLAGGSAAIWQEKHVRAHHLHTNVKNEDTDLNGGFFFVFSPLQKKRKFQRFQHIYAALFYCLLTIKWLLLDDAHDIITNRYRLEKKKRYLSALDVLLTRLAYLTLSFIVPWLVFGGFIHVLVFWLIYNAAFGLSLTLIFQCAHINTKTQFYAEKKSSSEYFSVRQLQATADFATKNSFLTWATGGLNFQVIHHLFPTVNHRHYPAIQKILIHVLEKYPELKYNHFPTFLSAIMDHFTFLRLVYEK